MLKLEIIKNTIYFFGFLISFLIGYLSNKIISWNYDIFYLFSQLIFYILLILIFINFFAKRYKFNFYIQILGIYLISTFSIAVLLGAIQEQFLFTRWLELGIFSSNDADDYVQQSKEYLYNKKFYTEKGRVLFPIIYAGLLGVFKLDEFVIQILITILCALIIFINSILIKKNYGYNYAVFFSFLSVDFIHENIGGVSTENIGFIFGGISFIYFHAFLNFNKRKLLFYTLSITLLLIGYMIRPSTVFILPAIILFSLIYISKFSKFDVVKFVTITSLIFLSIIQFNKKVLDIKSPNSPKDFNNAYDSFYATGQLGKFFLNNKYSNVPPQLWTKIYVDYPELKDLKGKNKAVAKKLVVYKNFIENSKNYYVGSLLQILNFYQVSIIFKEEFHNSAGFLHIEFTPIRTVILFLFTFGGIVSAILFIKKGNNKYLFFSFLYLATIFSQPLIYGGEARTAATVIFYLNYLIIFSTYYLIELIKRYKFKNYNIKEFIYKEENNNKFLFLSALSPLVLTSFFLIGLENNFKFISNNKKTNNYSCSQEKKISNLHFHSRSGVLITPNNKNFEKILNTYVDIAVILSLQKQLKVNLAIPDEDYKKRDKFKVLLNLVPFINTRSMTISDKEMRVLKSLGKTYLSGGGYYITPFNNTTKKKETFIILNEDLVKKGFNNIYVCL